MKAFVKALCVITNLLGYAAGLQTAVTLLFRLDSVTVLYISTMSTNEALLFNTALFTAGLALTALVINLLVGEYSKKKTAAEFPVFYLLLPAVIGIVFVVCGIRGETPREKLIVIVAGVLYVLFEAVNIYCGSAVFQRFPKEK